MTKRRDPRLALVDALWDAAGIADVKAVAMALTRYLDERWCTTTSIKSLASIAGVNEKTAREVLSAFVETGAVTRRERFGANGAQTSPEWTVTATLPAAVAIVSEKRDNRRKAPPRARTPVPPTVPGTVGGTPPPPGTAHGTPPVPPTVPPPVPPVIHDPGILIRGSDPIPQTPASGSPPADAGSSDSGRPDHPHPETDPPIEATVEEPPPRVDEVATAWAACCSAVGKDPVNAKSTTGNRRGMIRQRLAEVGLERFVAMCRWVETSPHPRAQFLRRDHRDPDTLIRKANCARYCELAEDPNPVRGPPARGSPRMSLLDEFFPPDTPANAHRILDSTFTEAAK